MLNFYANPLSPFATKVHYFLEETGIPYKYHLTNLRDEKARAQLNAANPFSKVPGIELNGFGLGESNAILHYLAAKYEQFSMYPLNLEERAQVEMVADFAQAHVARWFTDLGWNIVSAPKMGIPADEKAIEQARSVLPGNLGRLEKVIGGQAFLCGPNITLADVTLLPFIAGHKQVNVSLADFPKVQGWVNRMVDRPAWKKVAGEVEKNLATLMGR